jgi:hypothetical protein
MIQRLLRADPSRLGVWLLVLVALVAASFLGLRAFRAVQIDACLDRGGSFDYEAGVCDFDRSHPAPTRPEIPDA